MSPLNSNTVGTLENAVSLFRDHEGVNINKVEKWSAQFGQGNQELVLKILSNINYFSGPRIRRMVEELVESVCDLLKLSEPKRILFVPIGELYEGSAVLARALRGYRNIQPKQIKHQTELAAIQNRNNIRAIVFLDVFSGTGRQICDWWTNMETLLLPLEHKSIKIVLGILAMNYKARDNLKSIPAEKLHVSYLGIKNNVLSDKSKAFLESEKNLIKKFCKKTACSRKYLYGMGECGLLVAFKHGCPNNSLPILWYKSDRWENIFLRRGL
jgi:hypothetical protein